MVRKGKEEVGIHKRRIVSVVIPRPEPDSVSPCAPVKHSVPPQKEEVRFPKKAVATDGTLQIVVNDGFYMQGVRVEVCLRESSACQFDEAFPQGYTTVCKQKFIARKLVAVSPGKNPVRPITVQDFLIPSCCVCSVIQTSLNSRIGRYTKP